MITKALSDFTSPIVDKALETGARGKTTTITDYGVIGDAFFKKANLELGIANLQANMGIEAAKLKSGLEMDKADLALKGASMKMDASLKGFELVQAAEADVSTPFDMLLGAAGGAAQGASAGAAFGGKGALIGGVIGGVAGLAGAKQGRSSSDRTQQTLGTIANAAHTIKGFQDQRKSEDAWVGLMGTAKDIMAMMNSSDPAVAAAGREQWGMFQAEAHKVMSPYMNPEQIDASLTGLNDFAQSGAKVEPGELDRSRMFQKVVDFESDDRWLNGSPAQQKEALNEFLDEMDIEYAMQNAGEVMPPELQMAWAEKLGKQVGVKGLGEMVYNDYVDEQEPPETGMQKSYNKGSSGKSTGTGKTSSGRSSSVDTSSVGQDERETKALPNPSVPKTSRPAPEKRTSGIPFRLPEGNGIEMDDGMDIFTKPVQAERELHKIGEKSAEVMREKEDMNSYSTGKSRYEQRLEEVKQELRENPPADLKIFGDFKKEERIQNRAEGIVQREFNSSRPITNEEAGTLDKMKENRGGPIERIAEGVFGGGDDSGTAQDEKQAAYQELDIESATKAREEVDALLDEADVGNDKIATRMKTGMRDAMYSLEKLETAAENLPEGYFNELAMRAHAEGLKTTDYATVIAVVGTGVKGKALVAALKKAGGASALKAAGAMGILGLAENATGTLSKIDADIIQPITKGKGYFLDEKEQKAVNDYARAARAFVQSQQMGETGDTKMSEATIEAEIANFLSFSDSRAERWRKIAGGIDEVRDSARTFHRERTGGGKSGGKKEASGGGKAPRPGSAAWQAEQEAKFQWEQEKKAREERAEGNFKLLRQGRRYGR